MNSKKIKICFPFYGADNVGGSHISSLELIKKLKKSESWEPLVVMHAKGEVYQFFSNNIGVKLLEIPLVGEKEQSIIKRIYILLMNAWILLKFIITHRIRIIHCNDDFSHQNWALCGLLPNVKLVWHQRGAWCQSKFRNLLARFYSCTIFVSEYARNTSGMISKNCVVIKNPFNLKKISSTPPLSRESVCKILTELECQEKLINKKWVCFISNFMGLKRPEFFLEIAIRLNKQKPDNYAFFMIGKDMLNMQQSLKEKSKKNKIRNIYFMGHMPEPYNILKTMDCMIFTGLNEGWPRVVIESMLCKVPVIATKSGGTEEIIKQGCNGYLCLPNDINDYCEKTELVCFDQKNKESLVGNGISWALENSSAEVHLSLIHKLYHKLLRT